MKPYHFCARQKIDSFQIGVKMSYPGIKAGVIVTLIALTIAALTFGQRHATSKREIRVLFLGNSLTAANDLPAMVQAMAASGGVKLTYEAYTQGGFNLEDHWKDGKSLPALRSQKWDYLVLQQGPSSLPESQEDLKKWAKIWADEARKYGVKPALYMVWPFKGQANGFELVEKSYENAARASSSKLLPAGKAWEMCTSKFPSISLYSPDHLHPTLEGSYIAALVIAFDLAGRPQGIGPPSLALSNNRFVSFPKQVAQNLIDAAAMGITRYK